MTKTNKKEVNTEKKTSDELVETLINYNEADTESKKSDRIDEPNRLSNEPAKKVKNCAKNITHIIMYVLSGVFCLTAAILLVLYGLRVKKPTMTFENIKTFETTPDDSIVRLNGEAEITCNRTNDIDEQWLGALSSETLADILSSSSVTRDDLSSVNEDNYLYYGRLLCTATLNGTFSVDGRIAPELQVESPDKTHKIEIVDVNGGSFVLKDTYGIFSDLTDAPDGTADQVKITINTKDEDGTNTILEYDLALKVKVSDETSQFLKEWKEKIDNKIAEEKRKKEEEERLAEEKRKQELEEAKAKAVTPAYRDWFRNSQDYYGKYIEVIGRVVQTDSTNSFCRIATKADRKGSYENSYDDIVYVEDCAMKNTKILEDDVIGVIGTGNGTKVYTTVIGGTVEIPSIKGMFFGFYKTN